MNQSYSKIDPENRDAVVWLQLALAELYPGPGAVTHIGRLGPMTEKVLRLYQMKHNLPVTGEPDETTLQKINQELQERGLTI